MLKLSLIGKKLIAGSNSKNFLSGLPMNYIK